jgi:hypothetical protein
MTSLLSAFDFSKVTAGAVRKAFTDILGKVGTLTKYTGKKTVTGAYSHTSSSAELGFTVGRTAVPFVWGLGGLIWGIVAFLIYYLVQIVILPFFHDFLDKFLENILAKLQATVEDTDVRKRFIWKIIYYPFLLILCGIISIGKVVQYYIYIWVPLLFTGIALFFLDVVFLENLQKYTALELTLGDAAHAIHHASVSSVNGLLDIRDRTSPYLNAERRGADLIMIHLFDGLKKSLGDKPVTNFQTGSTDPFVGGGGGRRLGNSEVLFTNPYAVARSNPNQSPVVASDCVTLRNGG